MELIIPIPSSPSTLLAVASESIYKTVNRGTFVATSNRNLANVQSLAVDPNDASHMLAATFAGLVQSTDSGATWRAVAGIGPGSIDVAAFDPTTPSIAYAYDYGGLWRSTDGGSNWTAREEPGTYGQIFAIDPTTPTTLYAGANGIARSTDSGATWSVVAASTTQFAQLAINPTNGNDLLAVARTSQRGDRNDLYGVIRSSDSGTTWAASNHGYSAPEFNQLIVDPQHTDTLYVRATDLWKSTNSGTSWSISSSLSIRRHHRSFISATRPLCANRPTVARPGQRRGSALSHASKASPSIRKRRRRFTRSPRGTAFTNPRTAAGRGPSSMATTAALARSRSIVDASTIYVGTYDGIFKSTTGGE